MTIDYLALLVARRGGRRPSKHPKTAERGEPAYKSDRKNPPDKSVRQSYPLRENRSVIVTEQISSLLSRFQNDLSCEPFSHDLTDVESFPITLHLLLVIAAYPLG